MVAKTWDEIYGEKALVETSTPELDLSDKDALRALALGKLTKIVQTCPNAITSIPAIRELLDRIDGKPGQAMTLDANINHVTIDCQISFTDGKQYIDVTNSILND